MRKMYDFFKNIKVLLAFRQVRVLTNIDSNNQICDNFVFNLQRSTNEMRMLTTEIIHKKWYL